MHIFGLTGGIASGKSTVATRFRERGVPVIDADQLARDVVLPGSDALRDIVAEFGRGVVGEGGALDRKALALIVFSADSSAAAARLRLESITHPRITQLMLDRAEELARAGQPLACYEAALIVEKGRADAFRPLVVASCPEEVQLARIYARDGLSRDEALARVRAQKSLAEKVGVADFVIDTSGTLAEGETRTIEALRGVCAKVGVDFARYAERK